ncbi:MAG: HAMP domain-containing histidine kinase [Deltaproteobacteria bacterium]|jgi:signal transduction histidine kinase|nr:HAMP domain-containing histidine kinase [Deltaproteobacteria bacterium]
MKWLRKLFNPLIAFIVIQFAWVLVVLGWLDWFIGSHRKLRAIAEKYSPELVSGGPDWLILTEGLLLLTTILAGVYVIFLYWSRQAALVREQRQFISQVTHELKSPLASLQLHLETIRRQQPPPEKQLVFLETMLGDTARLNGLIDNLLSASRIEQKHWRLNLQQVNFSDFIIRYFKARQFNLPRAGKLELSIEPDVYAEIDRDAMETVLRNLLENAILYSEQRLEITVTLKREGDSCHLTFADCGRGIEIKHQKKIFNMFYRVRRKDENIRGSGLGLFIVRATIKRHRGRISVESAGQNQGTSFHIYLPLSKKPLAEEPK